MGTRFLKPGDAWRGGFGLRNAAGASQAADSAPTATLCRNGTDDGTVTVTVTQISGGRYKFALTVPSGYSAGDQLDLWVSATVAGQSDTDVVDSCRLVGLDGTAANWPADLRAVAGDTAAAVVNANHFLKVAGYDAAGTPLANVTLPSLYPANVTQWNGTAVGGMPNSGAVTVATNNDKAGYSLAPNQSVSATNTVNANLTAVAGDTNAAVVDVNHLLKVGARDASGSPLANVSMPVTANVTQWGGTNVGGMPLAASAYTAPDNADVVAALNDLVALLARADPTAALTAIKTVTDKLGQSVSGTGQVQLQSGTATGQVLLSAGLVSVASLPATPPAGYGPAVFRGARAVTITVTDGTSPIAGAAVRITQGVLTEGHVTDNSGQCSASLDDGQYQVSLTKGGYSFSPATITVSGTATSFTEVMAANASPPAPPAGQVQGQLYTYDGAGAALAGVVIECRVDSTATAAAGTSFPRTVFSGTSNNAGLLAINLPPSANLLARRDGGDWVAFTSPASGTFLLPQVLGRPQD